MSEPISLTSTVADRRFGLLILGLFSTFGLYGLIWIQASIRLQSQYDQAIAAAAQAGIEIAATTKGVEGFPFRLELHAQAVKVTAPWGRVETDLIVVRGLPFQADHWVIDGGIGKTIRAKTESGELTADDARASVVGIGPTRRISVDIKRLHFVPATPTADSAARELSIGRLQYHSRPNRDAGGYDHALRVEQIGAWQLIDIAAVSDQTGRLAIRAGQIEQGQIRGEISGTLSTENSKLDGMITVLGDQALIEPLAPLIPSNAVATGSREIRFSDAPVWIQALVALSVSP
jgi:hypothetical protein